MRRTFIISLSIITLSLGINHLYAQTNGWKQFRFDSQCTGKGNSSVPQNPVIEKQINLTGDVVTPPAVSSDGSVFVSCKNDTFYAFNPDLTIRWKKYLDLSWDAGNGNSHPALSNDENTVYIFDNFEGRINAFNVMNGNLLWKSEEFIKNYGSGALTIADNGDILLVHGDIICVKSDGNTRWRKNNAQFHFWGAFSNDGQKIYAGSYGRLYIIDALSGGDFYLEFHPLWSPYPNVVDQSGNIYGARGGMLRKLNSSSNQVEWTYVYNGDAERLALDNASERVYLAIDDTIHALTFNGSVVWKKEFEGTYFFPHASPIIDANGNLIITSQNSLGKQHILVIDYINGNIIHELIAAGMPIFSQPVVANGKVYAGARGLVVFGENPSDIKTENLPGEFVLNQNYPNPFNPSTVISYQLPVYGIVTLKVYDLLGNEVATLVNELKAPGTYEAIWNAVDVSTGVYFYRLQCEAYIDIKKLILIK